MSTFIKKENLTISTGEYQKDGQTKKEWRTIGELITMQGDDGQPYQFFKMWGAGGVVKGKVFEQQDRNQPAQQQNQNFAPQQQPMQSPPGFNQQAYNQQQAQQQPQQGNNQGFPQHQG